MRDAGELFAQTGMNGMYTIANVWPGTFPLKTEIAANWIQTSPVLAGTFTVTGHAITTASGTNVANRDFGNVPMVQVVHPLAGDFAPGGVGRRRSSPRIRCKHVMVTRSRIWTNSR